MRFKQPAILHGLPRDLAIIGSGRGAAVNEYAEHLSTALLCELVQSGRSLDELYLQHVKVCRDCHEFVVEFCAGEKRLQQPE
jgi:hypothetical protein